MRKQGSAYLRPHPVSFNHQPGLHLRSFILIKIPWSPDSEVQYGNAGTQWGTFILSFAFISCLSPPLSLSRRGAPVITYRTLLCCDINRSCKYPPKARHWLNVTTTELSSLIRRLSLSQAEGADVSCDGCQSLLSAPLYLFPLDLIHPTANNQLRNCLSFLGCLS